MSTEFSYTISTDTANGALASAKLHSEIQASSITVALSGINASGDSMTVVFKSDLSSAEEITLNSLVSAHDGVPGPNDPQAVEIATPTPAFANKYTLDGKSLYVRETGVAGTTIAAGQTVSIIHTVSYPTVKINGATILGCKLGDTVNFKVLDSTTGTYTTVPNYMLNQFGFNVNMPNDVFSKQYPYDADLMQGMQVVAEYTNNGTESVTVYVNLDIHEVK